MVVTNDGLKRLAELIAGKSSTLFSYIGIGKGTTPESPSDTALQTEYARKLGTFTNPADGVAMVTIQVLTSEWNTTGITEAGILDAAASGNLGQRVTFTALEKTSSDEWQIDVYIKIERV